VDILVTIQLNRLKLQQ